MGLHYLTTQQAQALNRLLREARAAGIDIPAGGVDVPPYGPTADWGKLDDSLSSTKTATVSVWRGDPLADTSIDRYEVRSPPMLTSGTSLSSGSWVMIQRVRNDWFVTHAECT